MSVNSFTAGPGEMPYDGDYGHGVPPNAICRQCRRDFYTARDDDGSLCNACCDRRDADATEPRTLKARAS